MTPDDLDAIRERHARDMDIPLNGAGHIGQRFGQAHADRAALLDALDRLAAITVADGALAIGAGPIRPMDAAAVVLALIRARVEGRDA